MSPLTSKRHAVRLTAAAVAAACAVACAVACSDLTRVQAPDVTQPQQLASPAGALVRFQGAYYDFASAFSNQVLSSGAFADELLTAGRYYPEDQRTLPAGGYNNYPYTTLSKTRIDAAAALDLLHRYRPVPTAPLAEMFALTAYVEVFFAENMCSGVMLSSVVNGVPVYGTPVTRDSLLGRSLADFDSAAAYAGDSAAIVALTAVGRGRALVDLGRYADAAVAVAAVPTAASYAIEYAASAQRNGVSDDATQGGSTVSDHEGTNGLNFVSANDPRVPTQPDGTGSDGITPVIAFTPYLSPDAPIVLANGVEARLIEAEASLASNDPVTWLATLNALRATVPGLPPIADPVAPAARVDTLFTERAFWLFLTGHRHGDLRRLIRQYGRAPDAIFPTGAYPGGLRYGEDTNIPAVEGSSASSSTCFNRDP